MLSRAATYRDVTKFLSLSELCVRAVSLKTPRDKGPERNYRKKIKKELRAENGDRTTEENADNNNIATAASNVSENFLDKLQNTEEQAVNEPIDLSDVLTGIKIHVRSNDDVRKNMGMPKAQQRNNERPATHTPTYHNTSQMAATMKKISFTDGKRLGIFNNVSPDSIFMSPDPWDFVKEENDKQVELLESLRPYKNSFEKKINDKSLWQYPIDNEAYKSAEHDVGFEKHVFLEKELENGFPKKGPVRHFMELVVAGLTSNPHYTTDKKIAHISWFRDYFSQFPDDELHTAIPAEDNQTEQ